jgi:hypothetical protein
MHIAVRAVSLSLRERMDFPSNNNRGPHVIGVARTEPASEVSDRPWFTTVAQLFTYLYIHTHSLIYTRAARDPQISLHIGIKSIISEEKYRFFSDIYRSKKYRRYISIFGKISAL